MAQLHKIGVHLTEGQKRKLTRAYKKNEGTTIRLANSALSGNDVLMVPSNTVKKLSKHRNAGKGIEITIAKSNIRKQSGSGIFSAVLPALRAIAPTVAKTLGISALAGAASEGASQIIKKITGGQVFQIPNDKLFMLTQMSHLLTPKQKRDLATAHQLMQDMNFRVTEKNVGNGIGSILASIGIPLVIDALKVGSAVRIGNTGGAAPRIGRPPSFIGSWEGRGKKKKRLERSGSIQKPKFHRDIPMSNFDLLEWCKYLKIPINNVLSRDVTVPHNHKLAIFIYNLEPSYMSGSHWLTTYVKDSFGMPPFQEIVDHSKKKT